MNSRPRSIGLELLATALTLRAVELTTEPPKSPPARKAILLRLDPERWERLRQRIAVERRPTQTVLTKLIDDYLDTAIEFASESRAESKKDRRQFNFDKIPPDLYDAVKAKCQRESISLRALVLRFLTDWIGKRGEDLT